MDNPQTSAFAMLVEEVFSPSCGTVATGQIIHGTVRVGDSGFLVRAHGFRKPIRVAQIHEFKKTLDQASAGLHVGLQLRGVEKNEVHAGDLVQSTPTEPLFDPEAPQCGALSCHCPVGSSGAFCDWHAERSGKEEAFPLKAGVGRPPSRTPQVASTVSEKLYGEDQASSPGQDKTTALSKVPTDSPRAESTPETAARPLTTQVNWLESLRKELGQREPLGCPSCGAAITSESLQSSICDACRKPFFQESRMAPGLRRALWLIGLLVVIAAVIVAIVTALGGIGIAGVLASGSDRSTRILVLLIAAAAFIGLVSFVASSGSAVLRYFSPKVGPQRTLTKLAKQSRKSGNLMKAARFYAELLTYGYSDNFYTDTGRAYSFWEELGDQAQRLAFSGEYRDLLFYERYLRHSRERKRGSDYAKAAELYLEELVKVASDSPRLHPGLAETFGETKKLAFPFFKTLASPTIADREPATKPRENEGPCCKCGKVGSCWGLDAYATFAFGTKMAGLGATYYCHYLGYYELRLCAECLRRLDGSEADRWKADKTALRFLISRYLQSIRGYLVAGCPFELAGQWRVLEPRVEPREVVTCGPKHLRFLIEPPREEAKYGDLNSVKWNWFLHSEYEKYTAPGEWYPYVRC